MAAVLAAAILLVAILLAAVSPARAADAMSGAEGAARYFMPDAAASKIVTIVGNGTAAASIVVLTEAVAVKETGPKATIEHFGEVYAFSPNFIAVHRDEPTRITLWNLQPDDDHDFMLEDPTIKDRSGGDALMHLRLAPPERSSIVGSSSMKSCSSSGCRFHSVIRVGSSRWTAMKLGEKA